MGAFNKVNEIQIPRTPEEGKAWGWDPHEMVVLKGALTVGDAEYSSDATKLNNVSMAKMLDAMIVRWNLTDENNNVAVKSEQAMLRLPQNYFVPIMTEIGKITSEGQVSDPQGFLNSASVPSSTN